MSNAGDVWIVLITPRAIKEIEHTPPDARRHLRNAIDGLAIRPWTGDIRKLQGSANEWRLRVGDWRIRFAPDDSRHEIIILRVLPRGRAYRD
ncbi:MAG: type II toxin-antitoxin system RelE family toxin [Thermomicrobiales bacterium]